MIVGAAYWVLGALFVCRLSLEGWGAALRPPLPGDGADYALGRGAAFGGAAGIWGRVPGRAFGLGGSAVPLFIALTLELRGG